MFCNKYSETKNCYTFVLLLTLTINFMKVLKWIGIIILILIVLALTYSALQPNKMTLEESVVIEAPVEQVYAEVMNYDSWNQWATWNMKDPNMEVEYSGNPGEVGYKSSWKSENPEVGVGSQEIVELVPNKSINVAMNFAGWEGTSYANWTFEEAENGTKVSWGFDGAETPFYMNWMNGIMKNMVSIEYKASLKNLKERIESMPKMELNPMGIELIEVESRPIVSIIDSTDAAGISAKLGELYAELSIFLASNAEAKMVDMPLALYHAYSEDKVVLEAAMYYEGTAEASGRVNVKETPSGKTVKGVHYGDYNSSGEMHYAIEDYMKSNNLEYAGPCWEYYANDPTTVDTADIETQIYYPVK